MFLAPALAIAAPAQGAGHPAGQSEPAAPGGGLVFGNLLAPGVKATASAGAPPSLHGTALADRQPATPPPLPALTPAATPTATPAPASATPAAAPAQDGPAQDGPAQDGPGSAAILPPIRLQAPPQPVRPAATPAAAAGRKPPAPDAKAAKPQPSDPAHPSPAQGAALPAPPDPADPLTVRPPDAEAAVPPPPTPLLGPDTAIVASPPPADRLADAAPALPAPRQDGATATVPATPPHAPVAAQLDGTLAAEFATAAQRDPPPAAIAAPAGPAVTAIVSGVAHMSAAAAPASVAAPPAAQIATACLRLGTRAGEHHATVSLAPAELGQVTIHVQRGGDGRVAIAVVAARPETLALLQRDAGHLKSMLETGGFAPQHTSVSLRASATGEAPYGFGTGAQPSFTGSGAGQPDRDQRRPSADGAWPAAAPADVLTIALPPHAIPATATGSLLAGIDITA